jgi:hypothetical protein
MKNFIKLFLLNQENAMITSIPCNYENSFLKKLLAKDKPVPYAGKSEA